MKSGSPNASHRYIGLIALAVVYLAVFLWFDRLSFDIAKDERFYWPTIQQFAEQFPPPVSLLRNYDEPSTPLFFIIFGAVEHFTHSGIHLARCLNLVLSFALACVILRGPRANSTSLLACVGLLAFPYFLGAGIYLYPDVIAAFWVVTGVAAARSNRNWLSAILFALAIATRQYMVAFPAACVAQLTVESLSSRKWNARVLPHLASCLTLGGWYFFFGGWAPAAGREAHLTSDSGVLHVDHSLYLLSCIGVYYVVVEAILERRLNLLADWKSILAAACVTLLFFLYPPRGNSVEGAIPTMGYLDKALHAALPLTPRLMVLALLAVLAAMRFIAQGPAMWMLACNALVLLRSHTAWDKYALPLLAALWFLNSRGALNDTESLAALPARHDR